MSLINNWRSLSSLSMKQKTETYKIVDTTVKDVPSVIITMKQSRSSVSWSVKINMFIVNPMLTKYAIINVVRSVWCNRIIGSIVVFNECMCVCLICMVSEKN